MLHPITKVREASARITRKSCRYRLLRSSMKLDLKAGCHFILPFVLGSQPVQPRRQVPMIKRYPGIYTCHPPVAGGPKLQQTLEKTRHLLQASDQSGLSRTSPLPAAQSMTTSLLQLETERSAGLVDMPSSIRKNSTPRNRKPVGLHVEL